MSSKRRASPAEVRFALTVVLVGSLGVILFGLAYAMHWVGTWIALAGILGSVSFMVVSGLVANRRDRRRRGS